MMTVEDAMKVNTPLRLCGRASNELAQRLRSSECKANDSLRFSLILDFFGVIIQILLGHITPSLNNRCSPSHVVFVLIC
jgi:hypothetical protein